VVIDEDLLRALLDATDDGAALVLLEGRAQVANRAALESGQSRGAVVLLSRADLVDRLGTASPGPEELTRAAASLRDAAAKLGA
jgi:hypothetical protein